MLIYTNENNPAVLKLLIAANFSRKNVNIKVVNANGELHHFFRKFAYTWTNFICTDRPIQAPKH